MDAITVNLILSLIGFGMLIFLLVLGAIYLGHRMFSVIGRHRIKSEFDHKKLRASESLDFEIFHERLLNKPKELPPIRGEVMNPPVVDRCFDEEDD